MPLYPRIEALDLRVERDFVQSMVPLVEECASGFTAARLRDLGMQRGLWDDLDRDLLLKKVRRNLEHLEKIGYVRPILGSHGWFEADLKILHDERAIAIAAFQRMALEAQQLLGGDLFMAALQGIATPNEEGVTLAKKSVASSLSRFTRRKE